MDRQEDISTAHRHTPGTEVLFDNGKQVTATASLQFLQHGDHRILLVPQPSLTDVERPLAVVDAQEMGHLPQWRRLCLWVALRVPSWQPACSL